MKGNITLGIIKPYAVEKGYCGPVLSRITEEGFRISAMKFIRLSKAQAAAFYAVHKDQPFFDPLVHVMNSGPSLILLLEKPDAVRSFRQLIGKTNPQEAAPGTLRRLYGESTVLNGFHGSDSDENALLESHFFFSLLERF